MKFKYIDFCEEARNGRLTGLKCEDCGNFVFPIKGFCSECGGNNLRKTELSKKGTIETFTIIRIAPEGFEPPYIVALVKLPEGVTVIGNLEYDPDEADYSLLGKTVEIGFKSIKGDKYSGGDGISLSFSLIQ